MVRQLAILIPRTLLLHPLQHFLFVSLLRLRKPRIYDGQYSPKMPNAVKEGQSMTPSKLNTKVTIV